MLAFLYTLKQGWWKISINPKNYRTILSNLSALQQTLAAEWEGQAFQGFDRQFNELKPKVKEFAELLEQINVQLVGAARAMEEHDQALSQKFGLN